MPLEFYIFRDSKLNLEDYECIEETTFDDNGFWYPIHFILW